ncbi:condensation domain-containing protein [Prescottella defluvii]|nr:condensation domain-containing protein [Prescottella defluvii]
MWIERHEPLRSHAELGHDGRITRRTIDPDGIELNEVRHEYEFDADTVYERVHDLFDELTSPHRWPAYLFVTLEHSDPEPECTVFFAADHSIIDGLSVVLVAHEITSLYTEAMAGPPALLVPAGSYIDFGAEERAAASTVDHRHPAVECWRSAFVRSKGRLSDFPLDLGPRPVERVAQRAVSEWVFDAAQAAAFNTVCHRAGQNFFAGVLACFAEASAELTGNTVFRTVTPVHTRNDPHWATSLGWFVGLSLSNSISPERPTSQRPPAGPPRPWPRPSRPRRFRSRAWRRSSRRRFARGSSCRSWMSGSSRWRSSGPTSRHVLCAAATTRTTSMSG